MTPPTTQAAPVKAPPERRYTKGARTKERIVDIALELFSQNGFHGVSIRDIAGAAGLSHTGVLLHIDNKDALLIEVLRRREELEAEAQRAERVGDGDIVGFVTRLVSRELVTPHLVALYVRMSSEATSPDHPAHAFFVDRYERSRRWVSESLARYLELHPETPAFDPDLVAVQAIALMDGLQVQWLLDPDAIDMGRAMLAWLATLGIHADETDPPS